MYTLYKWRIAWRLQGEVVPATQKDPEGLGPTDKFTVVLESAGLNSTELSAYYRERGQFLEQVERWQKASQDANSKPVLTLKEQRDLEKLRAQDQREIKRLNMSSGARRRPFGIIDEGSAAGPRATEPARLLGVGLSTHSAGGSSLWVMGTALFAVKAATAMWPTV